MVERTPYKGVMLVRFPLGQYRHKAQQAEHSADNRKAVGSNPTMPIKQVDCE